MKVDVKKLQYNKEGVSYEDGYRIVYFYGDNNYEVGAYCKTIEGFMLGFVECDPIIDDDDIPPFISIDDILERCLDLYKDINGVAIYNIDGTCIQKKYRNITNQNIK